MTYRWVDHTAELELRIEADSEAGIFADALLAFAELVGDEGGEEGGQATRHAITLDADDLGGLLVAWLEELVYLAETAAFVPDRAEEVVVRPPSVTAVVSGRRGSPRHLVKAVAYHGLEFERAGRAWCARVVLDV